MIFDKLEDVPENLRSEAVEESGKFKVDGEGVLTKNAQLLSEVKTLRPLKDKVKEFEGINADEARVALEAQKQAAEKKKGSKGAAEDELTPDQVRDLKKKHTEELTLAQTERDQMRQSLEQHLIDGQIIAALAKVEGNHEVLLPHVRKHVKVFRVGEQFVAKVVDLETGNPKLGDSAGKEMTIEQLVLQFKKDRNFAPNFKSDAARGSGAPNSKAPEGTAEASKLPATERLKRAHRDAAATA
ncbi:MAG: hypothetical protein ACRDGM_20565 [bacterium]